MSIFDPSGSSSLIEKRMFSSKSCLINAENGSSGFRSFLYGAWIASVVEALSGI